jgi:hypothetical protein
MQTDKWIFLLCLAEARLQIELIYHGMKLMNTLCPSHIFYNQSRRAHTFSPESSLKDDSARIYSVYFFACCLHAD